MKIKKVLIISLLFIFVFRNQGVSQENHLDLYELGLTYYTSFLNPFKDSLDNYYSDEFLIKKLLKKEDTIFIYEDKKSNLDEIDHFIKNKTVIRVDQAWLDSTNIRLKPEYQRMFPPISGLNCVFIYHDFFTKNKSFNLRHYEASQVVSEVSYHKNGGIFSFNNFNYLIFIGDSIIKQYDNRLRQRRIKIMVQPKSISNPITKRLYLRYYDHRNPFKRNKLVISNYRWVLTLVFDNKGNVKYYTAEDKNEKLTKSERKKLKKLKPPVLKDFD